MRLFWKVVAGSLFLAIPAYLWDPHNLFFTWVAAAVGAFSALLNCNGVTPLDWDVSDAMLDPPQDVRDAIRKDPELSLFDACLSDLFNNVEAYGMEAVSARLMIESGENVTIFAPKDSAMACRGVERMGSQGLMVGFPSFYRTCVTIFMILTISRNERKSLLLLDRKYDWRTYLEDWESVKKG
ncbi:hypothetical protein GUITHDRAFT_138110 [Guillardia theta CCMP2712]|uniref:FAS1 domain-containing protein n=1 Tax=Guillardia theta (strain CCMP2712) TaxID=905079 RepID=L1JE46_GUITC|nr:hypothetical protein GUITHDRAFT_138110 [Guillardia theta CCMP2712]EKX46766.1 hypothetical protein GUITHDRAFT_138110 [Guillardia theta CCMP2712]|eukprot:XP_005833746.1 hypothetical protein GUITHDRAFT_138110 [Guillardia theta CCMP2712]